MCRWARPHNGQGLLQVRAVWRAARQWGLGGNGNHEIKSSGRIAGCQIVVDVRPGVPPPFRRWIGELSRIQAQANYLRKAGHLEFEIDRVFAKRRQGIRRGRGHTDQIDQRIPRCAAAARRLADLHVVGWINNHRSGWDCHWRADNLPARKNTCEKAPKTHPAARIRMYSCSGFSR